MLRGIGYIKHSCYWARVWLLGQKSGLQYPLGSLEITSVLIDVCPFSFSQTLFPAAWIFWQSLKFSFSFYPLFPPIFSLLSSWHKQNPPTTQQDHNLLPLILLYWGLAHGSKKPLFCTVFLPALKRTDSFRSPWAWGCLSIRSWMSKVTVKWGSFLCLQVYADIRLAYRSQLCPLHKALLQERLMQLLRRLFVMLIELAPEPRLGKWCNLSPPSSTWKIAFRAITLASFMCLKFQNDENKEKK